MIKVSGLPVNVTKSDLDELFSPYGTIQITKNSVLIKIEKTESIAHLELDKNEQLAIQELNNTKWRDYILYLDPIREDELEIGQPGGVGTTTKKFRLMEKKPQGSHSEALSDPLKDDDPRGGGNPNRVKSPPKKGENPNQGVGN
ncbi:hypothetical protein [Microcoleus sp. T3_D1]|uniref:hypothetical protein n=1 Tax=Microcoleus sp. T3_D1 TaxID=3055427 RepID=UPI002FCFBE37